MERTNIRQKVAEARPKLNVVSPLAAKIILIFGFGSVLLGYGLFTVQVGQTTRNIPIVNHIFNFQFHGFLFALIGLVMLYGYWRNNWKAIKIGLVAGLFIKVAWLFCLIILAFRGGSISLLSTWLMITAIQAATYIDFIPRLGVKKNVE